MVDVCIKRTLQALSEASIKKYTTTSIKTVILKSLEVMGIEGPGVSWGRGHYNITYRGTSLGDLDVQLSKIPRAIKDEVSGYISYTLPAQNGTLSVYAQINNGIVSIQAMENKEAVYPGQD